MDLIASQIAQLQEQARRQAETIAQLSSTVQAQAALLDRFASEKESKDVAIRQLEERIFPGGVWEWERLLEGTGNGRWNWAGTRRPSLHPINRPPATFSSLPVELLRLIFFSADLPERALWTRLSFRLLELFGPLLHSKVELWNPRMAEMYMFPRLEGFKASRLTPLLTTSQLTLNFYNEDESDGNDGPPEGYFSEPSPFEFSNLAHVKFTESLPPLPINHLVVRATHSVYDALHTWSNLLRHLQPTHLTLTLQTGQPPSLHRCVVVRRNTDKMVYRRIWDQLRSVTSVGPGSVLVYPEEEVAGRKDASIWEQSFEGAFNAEGTVEELETWLTTEYVNGRKEVVKVEGADFKSTDFKSTFEDCSIESLSSEEKSRSVSAVLRKKGDRVREEEEEKK